MWLCWALFESGFTKSAWEPKENCLALGYVRNRDAFRSGAWREADICRTALRYGRHLIEVRFTTQSPAGGRLLLSPTSCSCLLHPRALDLLSDHWWITDAVLELQLLALTAVIRFHGCSTDSIILALGPWKQKEINNGASGEGKLSLSRASISVTQLPSCLKKEKKEKSYLETEMREKKVEKQMQGAQTGVH